MANKFGLTLEESFLRYSQRVAVSDLASGADSLSYQDLHKLSFLIAQKLNQSSNFNDGTVVITQRNPLAIAALTGCFLSHTLYIPIDAEDPLERIEFILSDSEAVNIICDDLTEELIKKAAPDLVDKIHIHNLNHIYKTFLELELELKEEESDFASIALEHTKTASYMIYTSGTTGRPKGVLVGEGTLAPLLSWVNGNSKAQSAKKTLQYYSLAFDPSLLEIFSTLVNGNELVISDHATKKDLFSLVSHISRHGIERLFFPVSIVQLICEEFSDSPELFKSISEINCGGDRMVITPAIKEMIAAVNKLKSSETIDINNQYGPTEATIMVTQLKLSGDPKRWPTSPSIGVAVAETELLILDENLAPLDRGEKGVLYIGGSLLARGYWKNEALSAKNFIIHPQTSKRLYRTGDIAAIDEQGHVSFFGREDHQVKINGLRVECSEIENLIKEELLALKSPCDETVVLLCDRKSVQGPSQKFLAAAVKTEHGLSCEELKASLAKRLPAGMVPTYFLMLSELPLTANGKIDRKEIQALIENSFKDTVKKGNSNEKTSPSTHHHYDFLKDCVEVLQEVSGLNEIDSEQSLFEQSLTSLQAIKFIHRVNKLFQAKSYSYKLNIAELYQYPKLSDLENYLLKAESSSAKGREGNRQKRSQRSRKVAIVGMSCRFPKAESLEEFWELIESNGNGISRFSKEEMTHPSQDRLKDQENFVPARGILEGIDLFDAQKFKIPPRVAEVMDPQMRLILEESLKAISHTVYLNKESTGVFYGMSNNTYIDQVEALHSEKCEQVGRWNLATLNEKDYIATQVAHKLNLMGPALSIHTACSTSLVAIVQGVRAIQNGDCESALCGGIHIDSRHKTGHLHQEGSIFSKDGSCRPYDEDSSGTIFSDGVGVIVLKDYDLALADGNQIFGIVAGCGLNNDGGDKTSFTAPSVRGQSRTIEMALEEAGICADEIAFIEGHGTATPVGDPIEVQALVAALNGVGNHKGTEIGLTSVKAQIGHTVAASGVAGVIKAVLCLNQNTIPGTSQFKKVNPLLNIEDTPFVIDGQSRPNRDPKKKYCGVSSFGVGGTNAHIIIERVDTEHTHTQRKTLQSSTLLTLSSNTAKGLHAEIKSMLDFLAAKGDVISLPALAKALSHKEASSYRKAYVASSMVELRAQLAKDLEQWNSEKISKVTSYDKVIFAAPGQGSQYAYMGGQLYREFPIFREAVDICMQAYQREFDIDLSNCLFHNGSGLINFTQYTQPCLFVFQYAMLSLLESFDIEADFLLGHSVGEFAIAAHNGLMSVQDAIGLIGKRGILMAELPAGKMLSVREDSKAVEDLIDLFELSGVVKKGILSMATVNSESLCVVGGESQQVDAFAKFLESRGIMAKALRTSHAFHTEMMNPIVDQFAQALELVDFKEGVGQQIATSAQGHDISTRAYWSEHIVAAVNFKEGLNSLASHLKNEDNILAFDIGPRFVAGQLMKQSQALKSKRIDAFALNKACVESETLDFLSALARAWEKGLNIDLRTLYGELPWCETPNVVFDRKSYWAGYPLIQERTSEPSHQNQNNHINQSFKILKEECMANFKNTLKTFIEDKSGFSDLPIDASFLELGLDSLLLTQLAIDLKNEYAVEVGFRDLMDSIDTIDALGDFLTQSNPDLIKMAQEVSAAAQEVSAPQPVIQAQAQYQSQTQAAPAPMQMLSRPSAAPVAMSSDLGAIIQGQMDLMRMHLELMSGVPATSQNNIPVAAPTTATQVPVEQNQPSATLTKATAQTNESSEEESVKGTVNTAKVAFGAQARVNTIREESQAQIKESVDKIISAYCAKTPQSKAYTQKYRKVNADPRVVTGFRPEVKELTYPLVVNRSKDQRLWDIDGNEYVDVTCGFGSNFFGNQNERITKALHDQLDRGFEIGPQHELAGECAELICELTGNERAGFCNTGSEAVLGALRVARTITGRQKIVMFKGSYHGINDEVIVRGRGDGRAMPAAAGINPSATKDMILLDYGTDEALAYIRDHAKELAAVIVEPVQSRRSDFHPKAFLQEVRAITEASETAFIFDEVITGFRIALGGAQEYFGIRADLVTYGKIIGGGMPIGIVSGKSKFMDALDGGDWQFGDDSVPTTAITYFAGTFVRHPLALRALKEALLILKEGGKDLYFNINQKAQKFVDQLNLFCEVFGAPIAVDNFGGVLKPRFTDSGKNNDLFFALMRLEGVHCYDGFPWFVTLGHQQGDLEFVGETWKKCIIQMQSLGLFPKGLISSEVGQGQGDFVIPPQSGSVLVKSEEGKPTWVAQKETKNQLS